VNKLVIAAVGLAALFTLPAIAQRSHLHQTAQITGQLDMNAVPHLNNERIRHVQQALHDKGFDPGPADGILGARTKQAARDFQDRYEWN
jgi:hypothetical protein